jgi:hypothetical protein
VVLEWRSRGELFVKERNSRSETAISTRSEMEMENQMLAESKKQSW